MRSNISSSVHDRSSLGKSPRSLVAALLALAAIVGLSGCATGVKDTTRTFKTVVIDAGHGGHDSGATSRWGGREKHHALSVATKLEPKLRAAGFKTVMTRTSDVFVPLNNRARISNRQSNAIFVSVHFNHSPRRRISGAEVYYKSAVSRAIADRVLRKIDAIPGTGVRYVKTANFRVLKLNQFPAILVECGYLSNRGEGSRSASPKHHEYLASAIAQAIIEYRGLGPVSTPPATVAIQPPATTGTTPTR